MADIFNDKSSSLATRFGVVKDKMGAGGDEFDYFEGIGDTLGTAMENIQMLPRTKTTLG